MGFVENFIRFPAVQKCENRLRFDKVTESLMIGTFSETQCRLLTESSSVTVCCRITWTS